MDKIQFRDNPDDGKEILRQQELEQEIKRIRGILSICIPLEAKQKARELLECAQMLDTTVNQIKNHPQVKDKFHYNGEFFESEDTLIRIEDGLHFLMSLSESSFEQAFTARAEQGVLDFIEVAKKDLNKAIDELENIAHTGNFKYPVPKTKS